MLRTAMFINGRFVPWAVLRGLEEAREFAPTGESAQLHAAYSIFVSTIGLQKHSVAYVESSLRCAKQTDDEHSAATAHAWSGSSSFAQGDFERAAELLRIGKEKFEYVGGDWHMHLNNLHLAQSLYLSGKLKEALLVNWTTFCSAAKLSDVRTNCTAYLHCRITDGRFPLESIEHQIVRKDEDVLSTCNLDKAYGIRQLHLKEFDKAIQSFERSLKRPYKVALPNWHVIAGLPLLVRAHRLHAKDVAETQSAQAQVIRRKAKRIASRSLWVCRFFPTEYSFALREYGLLMADCGKIGSAERFLKKSCKAAQTFSMDYELAKSQLALALLHRDQTGVSPDLEETQAKIAQYEREIATALAEIEIDHTAKDFGFVAATPL